MTTIEHARRALRSEARIVVVEAAAGCGKTHEACALARDYSSILRNRQQVLLLAHTNAATDEFRRRLESIAGRVFVSTFDAFALEILRPYSKVFNLAREFRVGPRGDVEYKQLTAMLVDLLSRAPSIARHVNAHFPVLIFDEHQDASKAQHGLVEALLRNGAARVRLFGDPMQTIYDFSGDLVEWHDVTPLADEVVHLEDPWRWRSHPGLGDWIMQARESLERGENATVTGCDRVRLHTVRGVDGGPEFYSAQPVRELATPLHQLMTELDGKGSVLILTKHNKHVLGIRRLLGKRVPVYEGADVEQAYEFLEDIVPLEGSPKKIGMAIVGFLKKLSAGVTASVSKQMEQVLQDAGVDVGRKKTLVPFAASFTTLYEEPNAWGACLVVGNIYRDPPQWLKIHLPEALRLLGLVRKKPDKSPAEVLDYVAQVRKRIGRVPRRSITTVHKSKGREASHVVVVHCTDNEFPDTGDGRRLLYVAMSRAKESVVFLVPEKRGTSLLIA